MTTTTMITASTSVDRSNEVVSLPPDQLPMFMSRRLRSPTDENNAAAGQLGRLSDLTHANIFCREHTSP